MMSASALVTFAAAHMADGTGANGATILSPESARAMRAETTRMRGEGAPVAFGLGWMLSEGGFVSHGGGGPGILANLTAHPESNVAVAVLANSSHSAGLTGELANKWMEEAAGVAPPEPVVRPIIDTEVDVARYAGRYENIAQVYEIVEMDGGIGVSLWAKFAFYDDTPMEPTPPIPLKPVGNDAFTYPDPEGNPTASIMSFLDPRPDGRMTYIAQGARMVPRAD